MSPSVIPLVSIIYEFSRLSLDNNSLHHDEVYARSTKFGTTIVPLHLALSPFSAVAECIFQVCLLYIESYSEGY